jgi:hypothetical protein
MATEETQQPTTETPKRRGRWPRVKNKNMARGIEKSTWLTFCRKYRQEIISKNADHFSTLSLPEKTSTMARAYRHFVATKANQELSKKPEGEGLSPYTKQLMQAITETGFEYKPDADKEGFLSL